ncbi:MAG: PAS domain-containing sensor histidine kinase [Acidobacteriaceae bacterium]
MPQSTPDQAAESQREQQLLLRAEQAESRIAELFSTMPQAYIAIDREWRVTSANHQAAVANRMRIAEFVGKDFWTIWPEVVGTDVERQYRRVMETRQSVQFEYFNQRYDAWFEMNVHPIQEGIGVYYQDATQRRRAEEALRESQLRYHAFTELNPQLILMSDIGGQVTYANQRLLAYAGLTLKQACGEGWRTVLHPEDDARVMRTWQDALVRDVEFELETRIRRASDGEFRWFWVRGLPVRDEKSRTLYWLGVCIEIHDRKSAVEELTNSQRETERQKRELESLYRNAPIGLAAFDPVEFRCLRLNDRQAELVGLPMAEILGRTITEIAPIEGLHDMFQQVAQGVSITNRLFEGELPAQPGVHRYWTVNCSPVYALDCTVQAITAAFFETTAQKRAEMALIQSEKLAAVGRLASSISHEINNPLEAVTNLLYLAARHDQLPADVRLYLRTAQDELARVSQISTQSLRFHRQTMNPTLVSTADLMNSVVDLYRGRLANSNIQVYAKYSSALPVLCFENDIRQVLNNLIANAFDAMRQGGRLLLRTHDTTDWRTGRKGVRLTVADTGHGMPPQVKQRLFEAFYTTKDLNGTGLGLWISRGIAVRHHGDLTLRSTEKPDHSGTVFSLFLPECCRPDSTPADESAGIAPRQP